MQNRNNVIDGERTTSNANLPWHLENGHKSAVVTPV